MNDIELLEFVRTNRLEIVNTNMEVTPTHHNEIAAVAGVLKDLEDSYIKLQKLDIKKEDTSMNAEFVSAVLKDIKVANTKSIDSDQSSDVDVAIPVTVDRELETSNDSDK